MNGRVASVENVESDPYRTFQIGQRYLGAPFQGFIENSRQVRVWVRSLRHSVWWRTRSSGVDAKILRTSLWTFITRPLSRAMRASARHPSDNLRACRRYE
jgi:hypothetical protein